MTSYTYDVRNRFVGMAYLDGRKFNYAWDANDNRTELIAHVAGPVLNTQYTYDAPPPARRGSGSLLRPFAQLSSVPHALCPTTRWSEQSFVRIRLRGGLHG